MPKKPQLCLTYAIDDKPEYAFSALQSIRSLRRFNREIPVHVYHFGPVEEKFLNRFRKENVETHEQSRITALPPTCIKWLAIGLCREKYSRLLVLDADTFFFRDPIEYFDRYKNSSFFARREVGGDEGETIGKLHIKPSSDRKLFEALARANHSVPLPIFNTGVMGMSRAVADAIVERLPSFYSWVHRFQNGKVVYPSYNPHLIDEIVGSLILGEIPGFTYDLVDPEDSPWYYEIKKEKVRSTGYVVHIWNSLNVEFLKKYVGEDVAQEFISCNPKWPESRFQDLD